MKALTIAAALVVGLVSAVPAVADHRGGSCSTRSVVGRWIFATDVGQFPAFGGDITAIGTMSIDREGNLSGEFDVTIAEVDFVPDVEYGGSITINADCTGTVTFETSLGTVRTDSVAVVGDGEMWGMSQDPGNLWTYRVKRLSRRRTR